MFKKLLFSLFVFVLAGSSAFAQITSVGLIGEATPNGWDADTNMVQDPMNPDIWTLTIDLTTGAGKFRANDDWTINWGDTAFPTGTGTQDGPDIPIAGGPTVVTLNSATGEYSFVSTAPTFDTIGLVGSATPFGNFDDDVIMERDSLVHWVYTVEVALTADEAKFRANRGWTDNWGGTDFPAGVGVAGAGNIPVAEEADYKVTFNTATFEYNFERITPVYNTIGLIGAATPGLDTMDTDLMQNPVDPNLWSANMTLTDGWAKFRAEDGWAVNWGADSFPTGIASMGGDNIPVIAGEYSVKFNSNTGEYSFEDPVRIFSTVGIIGTGTGLEWAKDIDMTVDPANPDEWYIELRLKDGVIKFRADNDWDVNWGDDGFPTGTGTQGGPDIPVFAGTWAIRLNATTGVYSMTPVSVGIVGPAAPPNSWDIDEDMACSDTLGGFWSLLVTLTDDFGKFRKDDDWAVNWGSDAFPSGTGTQDGPNIPITAGTYMVTINTSTGDYLFDLSNSTTEVLDQAAVLVFPNPAAEELNVKIKSAKLRGDVTVRVMDATGRILSVQQYNTANDLTIDVSAYPTGVYFLNISNEEFIVGKKVTIAR